MNKMRVAIFALASDFGCQLQLTNQEDDLVKFLEQFDLTYWQLVADMPEPLDYDIAVVEGCVTTEEHIELLHAIRDKARQVIALGSCACGGGLPQLAGAQPDRQMIVYDCDQGLCARGSGDPRSIDTYIVVDQYVTGCPVRPKDFVASLQRALAGRVGIVGAKRTLCGSCKERERTCLLEKGQVCLGLVTAAGCDAWCLSVGGTCRGCRGISEAANLVSARRIVADAGCDVDMFDAALALFNSSSTSDDSIDQRG